MSLLGVNDAPDTSCVKPMKTHGVGGNTRTSSLNPKEEGQKTGRRVAIAVKDEKKEEPRQELELVVKPGSP